LHLKPLASKQGSRKTRKEYRTMQQTDDGDPILGVQEGMRALFQEFEEDAARLDVLIGDLIWDKERNRAFQVIREAGEALSYPQMRRHANNILLDGASLIHHACENHLELKHEVDISWELLIELDREEDPELGVRARPMLKPVMHVKVKGLPEGVRWPKRPLLIMEGSFVI